MLFYTGIARTASDVAQSYATDLAAHARSLKLMRGHVEEGIDILMSGLDIRNFGELLHEAWQTKRALSERVSNAQVDELYDRARGAGAIGGKLTGAGGGGFLLLFVPPRRRPAVLAALAEQIHVPFTFESAGSQVIFYEPGVDYQKEESVRRARPPVAFRELPSAV
jgi:D-glycero-alpha-D-manno-heptose-7-phosphate kinase